MFLNSLTTTKGQRTIFGIVVASIVVIGAAAAYLLIPQGKSLQFEVVHDNVLPEKTQSGDFVIDSETVWQSMWKTVAGKEPKEASGIDFTKESALAAFAGTKGTSGYSTLIIRVMETDHNIKAFVEDEVPGARCFYAQALSNPYHLVKLPKLHKKVVFVIKQKSKDCAE